MGTDSGKFTQYLDEFIEEGLIKACDTGGSLGHPESNIFYMPTKGYNVWEDDGTDDEYQRHKGRYLTFVRLYLGALEKTAGDGRDDTKKWLDPCMLDLIGNSEIMQEYTVWLKRNEKSLQEMMDIDDFYQASKVEFSTEELEWITARDWYTENISVSECLVKL
jgi:hypothetical protein